MFKSLKKMITKYLETLAEQNKKQFGTKRMDCCDTNKKTTPHH